MTSDATPADIPDIITLHRTEDLDPKEITHRIMMITQTLDHQMHLQTQRARGLNPPSTLEKNLMTAQDIQSLSIDIPLSLLEAIGSTGGKEWAALPAEVRSRIDHGCSSTIRYGIGYAPDTKAAMYVIGAYHRDDEAPGVSHFTGAGFTMDGMTYLFCGNEIIFNPGENTFLLPREAEPQAFVYCGFSPEALPTEVLTALTHILEVEEAMSHSVSLPTPVDE